MFAAPAVAGELVFVGSCNGYFRALDRRTGELRWAYDTRLDGSTAEFHGDPVLTDELIIAGSDDRRENGIGYIYAFERTTGRARWKYRAGRGVMADVIRQGSRLFAVSLSDELLAVDLQTGRVLWAFSSGASNQPNFRNAGPAVTQERVYFGGLNGRLYALEATSGKLLWERDLGARISTSVVLHGGELFAGTATSRFYRVDPQTGNVLAEFPLTGVATGAPLIVGDSLVMNLTGNFLACLDLSLAKLRWTAKASQEWTSAHPVLWQGSVLVADHGELIALRPSDGSRQWSHKFSGMVRGIGIGENTLYVGTLGGTVYAYRPLAAGGL